MADGYAPQIVQSAYTFEVYSPPILAVSEWTIVAPARANRWSIRFDAPKGFQLWILPNGGSPDGIPNLGYSLLEPTYLLFEFSKYPGLVGAQWFALDPTGNQGLLVTDIWYNR